MTAMCCMVGGGDQELVLGLLVRPWSLFTPAEPGGTAVAHTGISVNSREEWIAAGTGRLQPLSLFSEECGRVWRVVENTGPRGREVQSPRRAGLGYGLCGASRLERESSGVLKRGTHLFGWLPGCEGKGDVKSSGLGHLPDPRSLTGKGKGGRKETNLGILCLGGLYNLLPSLTHRQETQCSHTDPSSLPLSCSAASLSSGSLNPTRFWFLIRMCSLVRGRRVQFS